MTWRVPSFRISKGPYILKDHSDAVLRPDSRGQVLKLENNKEAITVIQARWQRVTEVEVQRGGQILDTFWNLPSKFWRTSWKSACERNPKVFGLSTRRIKVPWTMMRKDTEQAVGLKLSIRHRGKTMNRQRDTWVRSLGEGLSWKYINVGVVIT